MKKDDKLLDIVIFDFKIKKQEVKFQYDLLKEIRNHSKNLEDCGKKIYEM